MSDFRMLVWLTQLGLNTVFPLAGYTLLAVWLRDRFHLGGWVIFIGVAVGLISAIEGFRTSLRTMERMDKKGSAAQANDRREAEKNKHGLS